MYFSDGATKNTDINANKNDRTTTVSFFKIFNTFLNLFMLSVPFSVLGFKSFSVLAVIVMTPEIILITEIPYTLIP